MTDYANPAFASFIDDLRVHFARGLPEQEHWEGVRDRLKTLCADNSMREISHGWEARKGREYILHHDPHHDFFVGALVRQPNHIAGVHDHGPTWTIYGVLQGEERIVHYDASKRDDGKFDMTEKHADICRPGDVDVVPPRLIHSEYAGAEKSIAVIVRSQRSGTFEQFRYLEDGSQVIIRGPDQAPYALS